MDNKKIYVGNLPYSTSEDDLKEFFGECGEVEDVKIIMDRETGRSKGFGFVTFDSNDAVTASLEKNNTELDGRSLRINIAKEKEPRQNFR